MHAYRLENNAQDKEFLAGAKVVCRAVIDESKGAVSSGDYILVELSNGKKYKGKILEFRSFAVEKYQAGDLVIIKA
jgi:hypothetical protein